MTRPVVWAADATRDTLGILRHIAQDDPDVAERIVDLIEAAGSRLGEIPTGRPDASRARSKNPSCHFPGSFVMPSMINPARSALSS